MGFCISRIKKGAKNKNVQKKGWGWGLSAMKKQQISSSLGEGRTESNEKKEKNNKGGKCYGETNGTHWRFGPPPTIEKKKRKNR